jgi:hypothetical protein
MLTATGRYIVFDLLSKRWKPKGIQLLTIVLENNMNNENKRTSMGKWSVALTLTPLILLFIIMLWLMIPEWQGRVEGESSLALTAIQGTVMLCGVIVITMTSLGGIGLAMAAIYKTSWRQGLTGLLFNITMLIIALAFWIWFLVSFLRD